MTAPEGQYEIHYLGLVASRTGWWAGHRGIDLKDPSEYAERLNERIPARVLDRETGEIWGQPGCSVCSEPHEGVDGSCLL